MTKDELQRIISILKGRKYQEDKSYVQGWYDALRTLAEEVDYADSHGGLPYNK